MSNLNTTGIPDLEREVRELTAELARLRSEREWIPASQPPNDDRYVIVSDKWQPVSMGWYDGKRWFDTRGEDMELEVTHWMERPLPPPPTADRDYGEKELTDE